MDLTKVDGIAESTAESLEEADITSVEELAESDAESVDDAVSWYTADQAGDAIENAQALVERDTADESDDEEESVEAETAESDEDTVEVSYEIESGVYYHVVSGILDEAIRRHQQNDVSGRDATFALADQVLESRPDLESGESVTVTLDVDMDDLNILQRSLSSKSTNYRSMAGITNLYGDLNAILDEVGEDREENWGL